MSLTKRTVSPSGLDQDLFAYSDRKVPASTPIGAPMRMPSRLMIALPTKALSRPPSSPGGGVIWVNRSRLSEAIPLRRVVHMIQTSQNRPNTVARIDSHCAPAFLALRSAEREAGIGRDGGEER